MFGSLNFVPLEEVEVFGSLNFVPWKRLEVFGSLNFVPLEEVGSVRVFKFFPSGTGSVRVFKKNFPWKSLKCTSGL